MRPSDEHHLLAKAATGDQLAIEELVRRHAPLVLAACRRQLPGADCFAIVWLPENLHSSQAIAVATDGQCSLIAQPRRGIVWRPDARPAAMALYLRQRLDRKLIRAPLRDVHWRAAASCAVVVEDLQVKSYHVESRQLYLDLAELVRTATQEKAIQNTPGF